MQIIYKGEVGFVLKGSTVTVALALSAKSIGSENVIITRSVADKISATREQVVFDWPGEYEAAGVSVMIIPVGKEKPARVTKVMFEDIAIVHLDGITEPLTEAEEERIGNIDILFVSTGKSAKLDAKKTQQVIEAISPRMVIPMNFAAGEQLEFAKGLGFGEIKEDDSLKVTKSALPTDRMDLKVLRAR